MEDLVCRPNEVFPHSQTNQNRFLSPISDTQKIAD